MTSMIASDGTAQFKFGTAERGAPHTVEDLAKLEPFICSYTDGEGAKQVRICFRAVGSEQMFILQQRVAGTPVAVPAHNWFNKKFKEKAIEKGLEVGLDEPKSV